MSLWTVFKAYQDDEGMIMKCSGSEAQEADLFLQQYWNPGIYEL